MTFQLNTSGAVQGRMKIHPPGNVVTVWDDLDPFTQGYVEALFGELPKAGRRYETGSSSAEYRPWAFSDLAPETLARIVEDCAAVQRIVDSYPGRPDLQQAQGRDFWKGRQAPAGHWATGIVRFPPVTAYLGDDGKVYLREQA